ncbi:GH92 family glycosyl hydrolase [Aquimarina sp. 2201CG14-23]|uniref:GH92 family glycosyl hydrolase n=1 Tax=Aquimarina mycalae TaxID=3040073 RepID=UPI0024781629|nr:GH92 family glycosyl hydrolase [Aquimarina sp. 2201CG14-23]MDH7444874.1 GH92 family glycosyl hydrolase [Aquimarina sp. 2201CG14-23]
MRALCTVFTVLIVSGFYSCKKEINTKVAQNSTPLTSYVNPFIGTGGHGHTYPGASMPFGMMQLSPDTRLDGWDGCSGYHYSDSYIYGFSHTHLSGTGVSDYGDILLMPTNEIHFNNGADGKKGYRAHFSHDNEEASPGYYKVHLDSTNIEVALTVTQRAGMHKYVFPNRERQIVILDLAHRDQVLDHAIQLVSDTEIKGYRHSKAWAEKQLLYYHIKFSKPVKNTQSTEDGKKMAFEFDNTTNDPIYVSVGISAVDEKGALKNLEKEIGSKTFDQVKKDAEDTWENQLRKIVIESTNNDYKTNFYTSLYHSMLAPNMYQDVDGRYRGMDLKIHQNANFDYYSVFSLWDTYRATHPLYTIIEQDRTNDFINTFLAKYDEGGIMPIWDLAGNYTHCMIGYHAVPVIADAYLKGIKGYDAEKAFEAMKYSATRDKLGLQSYKNFGYIPVEEESESVSKTLEYAYDDWTIAQMAKALNKPEDVKEFTKRAQYYKNVFDPSTKFMRGRYRNTWFSPFDPYEVNFNYTEANSWQYSFYVPQDISGFITLLGGKKTLEKQLDTLFSANSNTSGSHQVDITGLIGQYAHGNEPSHHMGYLYNYVNKPHKTQEKIHQILTELYTNTPDGISGNEDCGQMSAWYIFSSLGFYPVTPGSNDYIIGTPLFDKATIHLENGKEFTIIANNLSKENKYIASAQLNDMPHFFSYLQHDDIMKGGTLVFEMTNTPSNWATKDEHIPSTAITDHIIITPPFIAEGEIAFKEKTTITLQNVDSNTIIYYTLNDSVFKKYNEPIEISSPLTLKTYASLNNIKSAVIATEFFKIDANLSIQLKNEYANRYNGGGPNALINGIKGTTDYRSGSWQGFHDRDVIATIDLGSAKEINTVAIGFLEDQRSWIFYPTKVEIWVSDDGQQWKSISKNEIEQEPTPNETPSIKIVERKFEKRKARYVKIQAKTVGVIPSWHIGSAHDGRAWIFADEIIIK